MIRLASDSLLAFCCNGAFFGIGAGKLYYIIKLWRIVNAELCGTGSGTTTTIIIVVVFLWDYNHSNNLIH